MIINMNKGFKLVKEKSKYGGYDVKLLDPKGEEMYMDLGTDEERLKWNIDAMNHAINEIPTNLVGKKCEFYSTTNERFKKLKCGEFIVKKGPNKELILKDPDSDETKLFTSPVKKVNIVNLDGCEFDFWTIEFITQNSKYYLDFRLEHEFEAKSRTL